MTSIKLNHIDRFRDRHGKWRYYYRSGRGLRTALPGKPGAPEFMQAYEQAALGQPVERPPRLRGAPGTFDRLVQEYFASADFLRLADSSRRTYRFVIERLVHEENIGHRLVRQMTREHVRRIMSKRAATPGAANSVLQKLKVLIRFAIDNGWRQDDPTLRLKKFAKGEFHTWTEEEIAQFERRWPIGSIARLAFALLLYTGQRRSDVVTMSWRDVEDGTIQVVPLKTRRSTGNKLTIPIHPALAQVLATCRSGEGTILKTSFRKPFTSNGFGNFMADKIEAAGLPARCVTHGLRKAAARRLAEAGCSTNEIAAITGHATLAEVSRYTKAAEQRRLAKAAMTRLERSCRDENSQTLPKSLGFVPKIPGVSTGAGEAWWSRGESNP
jgi:integrase